MIFLLEIRSENNEYFKPALMPIAFWKIPQENQIHFIRWWERYLINYHYA